LEGIVSQQSVDAIIDRVKSLDPEDQLAVAEAIDRLTWARRWRVVCEKIEASRANLPDVSDEEVDRAVNDVRQELPLSARSSTRRS